MPSVRERRALGRRGENHSIIKAMYSIALSLVSCAKEETLLEVTGGVVNHDSNTDSELYSHKRMDRVIVVMCNYY